MREKLQRFMAGRYGNDRFNQFLLILALIFAFLSCFRIPFVYLIALALMCYAYFRMFSRNIPRRAAENQRYWKYESRVRDFFRRRKTAFAARKEYRIFKCPNCKQKLRVPRGKGKIAIRCRKCGTEFIRRS